VNGPPFGSIKIGLDSYVDPDGFNIVHFAFKVHRDGRAIGVKRLHLWAAQC
jgi:hypothetical protein